MTPRAFCQSGESELVKGGVHATVALLAGLMTAYNAAAWAYRRDRHLAMNTAIYAGLTALEVKQTVRHWTQE